MLVYISCLWQKKYWKWKSVDPEGNKVKTNSIVAFAWQKVDQQTCTPWLANLWKSLLGGYSKVHHTVISIFVWKNKN